MHVESGSCRFKTQTWNFFIFIIFFSLPLAWPNFKYQITHILSDIYTLLYISYSFYSITCLQNFYISSRLCSHRLPIFHFCSVVYYSTLKDEEDAVVDKLVTDDKDSKEPFFLRLDSEP